MRRVLVFAILLVVGGCSRPVTMTTDDHHPGNPDAGSLPAAGEPVQGTADGHSHGHTPAAVEGAGEDTARFVCPMHPHITSSNPEDRCPECGMKINKPVPPGAAR